MSGKPSREELLSALWEAYVFSDCPDPDRSDRQKAAVDALRKCHETYREAEVNDADFADSWNTHGRANAIWTILATDMADWLVGMPGKIGRLRSELYRKEGAERAALIDHLRESAIPPTHRPAIDPVPVLLPRWLFLRLIPRRL